MAYLRVFEHQSISIGETIDGVLVRKTHLLAFQQLAKRLRFRCFRIQGDRIRFYSYVGVLQLGSLTVEILPKLDRNTSPEDGNQWQSILIDMLAASGWLRVEKIAGASLKMKANSLLQYFINLFLEEIKTNVIPGGLPRLYERKGAQEVSIKGKFLWAKQCRKLIPQTPPYWQAYDQLSQNHWINGLLYQALQTISQLNIDEKTRKEARYLQSYFPKMENTTMIDYAPRMIPRRFLHCQMAIQLAQMICQNQSPDLKYGSQQSFALLFDMNRLFEAYIFRHLRNLQSPHLQVYGQTSTPFWQERQLRPDILLKTAQESIILDTKWKMIEHQKPSMEDLRQVYVYAQYFDAKKVILLYPHTHNLTSSDLIPFHHAPLAKEGISCQILMLDLFTPMGGLRKNVGKALVNLALSSGC